MFWLMVGAAAAVAIAMYLWRTLETLQQQFELAAYWFLIGIGAILLIYVYSQVISAYDAAVKTGEDPGILPQLISITTGLVLLYIGWRIWKQATDQPTTFLFFLRLLGGMVFIVGGWIMIGEIHVDRDAIEI